MSPITKNLKYANIAFILSALTFLPGLYLGISNDNWGWWYIPLLLVITGLVITMRASTALKKPAKSILILISSVLVLLAIGMIGFVIWFSGF